MKRSAWRTVGHWVLVGFAAWLLLTGLFAWVTVGGRTMGALQALSLGLPPWHLIVPLYGAASLVLLLTRRPGAYWYLAIGNFIFAFAVGLPLLGSWEPLLKTAGMEATIWSALIFILGLLVSLVSLAMMFTETVPLGAFAARLAYFGRLGHLPRAVRAGRPPRLAGRGAAGARALGLRLRAA